MSSENDRNRKGTVRRGAVVSPEAASDHSTIQNVFDFIQDYVPQAVSGPKEERKERVLWARFEVGEMNDLSLPHHSETRGSNGGHVPLPLLLILGLSSGYSIWMIMPGGDAREVYYSYGEGETARTVRLLKSPEEKTGVARDAYADKRPIMAVVKKGRHSTTGSTVAYSTLHMISLRSEEDSETWPKKYLFKTRPIMDVQCNRRVVVIVFQKRIVVLCAGSLENKFVIKNNYPSASFPCNPVALGTRWLAYSEIKLSSKHQSIGGMSHTTTNSMATTMLKNVRKGISALTETISGLTAKAQGSSLEPTEKPQQEPVVAGAGVITVIDTGIECQQQEVKLQDLARDALGKQGAVVAHFLAHAGPEVRIAALAFNPSGNLLVSASTEGHAFHVFQLLPHPFLSSETAVHHLYTLYRGATSGVVQDITFSSDSRWVAVSTLNGTTHVFPMSPYGGEPTVRTHTSSRVVNKMSRFHTSAGMDSITSNHYHSHNSVPNSKNAVPRSSQSHVQLSPSSPPQSIANHRETPSIPYYMNGYNRWSNPRSLPLPTPVIVTALQQIKQPYQSPLVGGVGPRTGASRGGEAVSVSMSGSRMELGHGAEPSVSLAGPDAVCVCAVFGEPSDGAGQAGGLGAGNDGASYSLYVLGGNGVLVEHCVLPQKLSTAPDGEDAPVELAHFSKLCWRLMGNPPPAFGSIPAASAVLPLQEDNPLITANDLHIKTSHSNEHKSPSGPGAPPHQFTPSSSAISTSPSGGSTVTTATANNSADTTSTPSDDKWLSQVEILTHAPPSRRLWMGPQFSFKPFQASSLASSPGLSGSTSNTDLIKTPSPPNTIIYSSSLNSSVSANTIAAAAQVMSAGSKVPGERGGREEQSVALFPCVESPLLDILSETADMQGLGVNSSPLAVPGCGRKRDGVMEAGQKVIDSGMFEVLGSWNKVTPHLEGGPFEGELERQLEDAMASEPETGSITIVSRDHSVKTGFSPPGP